MNVVVFGEAGGGKSSTVNLLLDRKVAKVSDSAIGCTFQFDKYEAAGYTLYDTVGLSEGNEGSVKQAFAVKKLISLLKSLSAGVSLLVFVAEKGRIKKSLDENYKLFVDAICMNKVPVVLLITHCEMEATPQKWWTDNKKHFDKYGMNFKAVVCGCTIDPATVPGPMRRIVQGMNKSTVAQLATAIDAHMLKEAWKVKGGWMEWFGKIFREAYKRLSAFFGFPDMFDGENILALRDRLYKFFVSIGYGEEVSKKIADEIEYGI